MVWGHHLTDIELAAVAAIVNKDMSKEWRPSDHRISVEEIDPEDDLEPTLENIKALIPAVRQHLNTIADSIPEQMGHNAPPEMYAFTPEEIQLLKEKLIELENLPDEEVLKDNNLLNDIAKQSLKLSLGSLRYAASKGDIFLSNLAESAGTTSGKWAGRAIVIYMAGTGLKQFGELILQAIAGG